MDDAGDAKNLKPGIQIELFAILGNVACSGAHAPFNNRVKCPYEYVFCICHISSSDFLAIICRQPGDTLNIGHAASAS